MRCRCKKDIFDCESLSHAHTHFSFWFEVPAPFDASKRLVAMSKRRRAGKTGSQRKSLKLASQSEEVGEEEALETHVHTIASRNFAEYTRDGEPVEKMALDGDTTAKLYPGMHAASLATA